MLKNKRKSLPTRALKKKDNDERNQDGAEFRLGIAKPGRIIAVRFEPGDDLRESLIEVAQRFKIKAGVILSSAGSVSVASLRFANAQDPEILEGNFEILSLNGTIGAGGIHCHMTLGSDTGGVIGGHLSSGNIVYTTCEICILTIEGVHFNREIDMRTGYKEMVIRKTRG